MPLDDAHEKISAKMLGSLLGITERWVRELETQGFIVKVGYGKYDLAESIQGYVRYVRESEVAKHEEVPNSRDLFEAERARKLKLENDLKDNLLVETPDAMAAIDMIFGEVRTALAGIPARLTEDVAERRRIEDGIDQVLSDLADRLDKAGSALAEGRDPLEADATDAA